MSTFENFSGTLQKSTDSSIVLPTTSSKTDDIYKNAWIKIISDTSVNIRMIKGYIGSTFTVTLDTPLTFTPKTDSTFYITDIPNSITEPILSGAIISGTISGTITNIILPGDNTDDTFNNYWIHFLTGPNKNSVRKISKYIGSTKTATIDSLLKEPTAGDTFNIYYEFMGEYIILDLIDCSNFLGIGLDLSGIIDTIGGILNFQISSIVSCLFCLFSISILLLLVSSDKPGIGTYPQPLIIQMPMQTQPYPFNDSVFPRDS